MACPAIITGDQFLSRTLAHIDCQAQLLGSYGYAALGEPGGAASTFMAGMLTLFVALYGVRLLFGPTPGARDVVLDAVKVGIVLALAFSWPAFRTLIYNVVLLGPAEIAGSLVTSSLPATGAGFVDRLQGVDNTLSGLIEVGTGRGDNPSLAGGSLGPTFAGSALQDDAAFGYARLLYLAGTVGSLGLLRILGGLLLALAPLAAALLLFDATRGIFAGWVKGLVLVVIGSIGLTIVLAVELAMVEPWLADALRIRALGYAAPSAPIEIFAMALAFTLVKFGMIWLLGKVAFSRGWPSLPVLQSSTSTNQFTTLQPAPAALAPTASRAERTAESVERIVTSQRGYAPGRMPPGFSTASAADRDRQASAPATGSGSAAASATIDRVGTSWRRSAYRGSIASRRRDDLR